MPYDNEYAARINNPDKYKGNINRKNSEFGRGIDVLYGTVPGGDTEIQAIRFRTSVFKSLEQVKSWLKEHDYEAITVEKPKNEDSALQYETFLRFDLSDTFTMQETPEGFLKGVSKVTRTGVFTYRNADGTVRRELRHPEDVMRHDSLESLKMIPITDLHPQEGYVTKDNASKLTVGFTGERVNIDGEFVSIPISITTKQGINAVKLHDRKQLSLGYELELDNSPGIFNGDAYDYRQKNIRYNHLALVNKGRAGENVRLNIDSAIEYVEENNNNKPFNKGEERMLKINLDGIEYDAAPEVKNAFDKALTAIDTMKVELKAKDDSITKMRADADTQKAALDKATAELAKVPELVTKAVGDRITLERIALDMLPEEKTKDISKMSDNDIKKNVILSKFPDAKLDGENDVYIKARFDSAVELKDKKENADEGIIDQKNKVFNKDSKSNKVINLDDARKKYYENLENAYKPTINK